MRWEPPSLLSPRLKGSFSLISLTVFLFFNAFITDMPLSDSGFNNVTGFRLRKEPEFSAPTAFMEILVFFRSVM